MPRPTKSTAIRHRPCLHGHKRYADSLPLCPTSVCPRQNAQNEAFSVPTLSPRPPGAKKVRRLAEFLEGRSQARRPSRPGLSTMRTSKTPAVLTFTCGPSQSGRQTIKRRRKPSKQLKPWSSHITYVFNASWEPASRRLAA